MKKKKVLIQKFKNLVLPFFLSIFLNNKKCSKPFRTALKLGETNVALEEQGISFLVGCRNQHTFLIA